MLIYEDLEALEMELPNLLKRAESLMENLNCALGHAEWLLGNLRSALCTAEPVPAAEPEQTEEPAPAPVSLETVRKVLADKAGAGYAAEVRTLLQRHGAEKLSLVDPAEYVALMAEAQQLGATG